MMTRKENPSRPLFCYGTLRASTVMKAVTGHTYPGGAATLNGYAMFRVKGTEYPAIIPQKGGVVPGTLYEGLDEESLLVLDHFEGDPYSRDIVTVVTSVGDRVNAYVYVLRDACMDILSNEKWDFNSFMAHDIDRFMGGFVKERKRDAKRYRRVNTQEDIF